MSEEAKPNPNPGLKVVKFSQAVPDPTIPINFYVRGQNWISYGANNLYPNELITPLYNASAMNRTCITSKHIYAVGNGLKATNPEKEYVLNKANADDETWNDVFSRATLDYIIYGGCALQIIWNETGDKIVEVYNMDFNDIRSGHIDRDSDKVEWYFHSSDWSRFRKDLFKPRGIKSFDPSQGHLYPNQILYFFEYTPGSKYYPLPSYSGGLTAAQVDVSVDSFHYFNLMNGLSPSLAVSMNNGIPSPEEQQDIYSQLASAFSGVDGAGKFFLTFATDKEHGTEVTPIRSENDTYYIQLSQRLAQQILTSHRITSPLLLGIKDIGGSGLTNNKDEITIAALHFQTTTITPIQKTMIRLFNKILSYTGDGVEVMIDPLTLFNTEGEEVGTQTVTEDAEINAQPL
jgi:hypothetical protein